MSTGGQDVKILTITAVTVAFVAGFIWGYQVKSWRLQYLKAKKDYLARKLNETENKLNEATGAARKEAR